MPMFSSVKSQSWYKRSAYVSLSSSFLCARFNPLQFFSALQGHNHRSASQTLPSTQVTRSVHYELALTNAICHTSNVSLLQASVKPCCDLPKQNTFPLLLLCLLYSYPHYDTFHTHSIQTLLFQIASTTAQIMDQRKDKQVSDNPWQRDY